MSNSEETRQNVKQAIPFFMVTDMQRSLEFYEAKLGFEVKMKWEPAGKIEWCWLQLDAAALMLQEYRTKPALDILGAGVTICFVCEDALQLFSAFKSRGFTAKDPFVGNNMWVVELEDPDGYKLIFESATDVQEGTKYS